MVLLQMKEVQLLFLCPSPGTFDKAIVIYRYNVRNTSFKTQYGQQDLPTPVHTPQAELQSTTRNRKEEQRDRRRKRKVCQLRPPYYCSRTPSINLS
ncbi:hypothetical protein Avbf_13161 [Armadillidium vulgare]|nr:hypothetical protein Avbf_13161 [Armadillidium vulgare]